MNGEKKTKIICTIGPACSDKQILMDMVSEGVNVVRFNFSHMRWEEALEMLKLVRGIRDELGVPLSVMLDTKGPEVRLYGYTEKIPLKAGSMITVESYTGDAIETVSQQRENQFFTNLPTLGKLTHPGSRVLIMDGLFEGEVVDISDDTVHIELKNSGVLRPKAHFSVPNTVYPLTFLSKKDQADILFALNHGIEYIALSFVSSSTDIFSVRNLIIDNFPESKTKLIAKIENKAAVDNIDEIISHADGVMVARGDMGVEMDLAEVPIMQKQIIEKCFIRGKPVITATQMLESMIEQPIPTRAEASDVANACFDLTSAVMLSGETAIGRHPLSVVKTMAKIVRRVEEQLDYDKILLKTHDRRRDVFKDLTTIVNGNAVSVANESGAKAIVVVTKTGYSARMMSKLRPRQPIWAFTYDQLAFHQMALNWGVHPYMFHEEESFETIIEQIKQVCLEQKIAGRGERIVIVGGLPLGKHGTTNMVRVETIGKKPIRGRCLNDRSASAAAVFIRNKQDLDSKDISGKIIFLNDFHEEYVRHFKIVAGIVMETDQYARDLSLLGIAFNIPILIGAADVFEYVSEGSLVEIDGEKNRLIEV